MWLRMGTVVVILGEDDNKCPEISDDDDDDDDSKGEWELRGEEEEEEGRKILFLSHFIFNMNGGDDT